MSDLLSVLVGASARPSGLPAGMAMLPTICWAERTRTCKCHFEKAIEMLGEFSFDYREFDTRRIQRI
jgi:hypothetical protein